MDFVAHGPAGRPSPRSPDSGSTHSVVSFDGTPIWYDLRRAAGSGFIVVLPGFWRTRRHPSIAGMSTALHEAGYSVATLDLRGHGDSGGRFGFNRDEYRDAEAVLGDLQRRHEASRFALIGLSLGGAVAVTTAARTTFDVRCLMLISPVADFRRIRPKIQPARLPRHLSARQALHWPRFEWQFFRTPKLRAVEEIASLDRPVCLIHAVDDWLVHHEHSEMLHEASGGRCELHLLDEPCGYHADRLFTTAPGKVESIVEPFLRRHFPP